jgi:hypothetical protein
MEDNSHLKEEIGLRKINLQNGVKYCTRVLKHVENEDTTKLQGILNSSPVSVKSLFLLPQFSVEATHFLFWTAELPKYPPMESMKLLKCSERKGLFSRIYS